MLGFGGRVDALAHRGRTGLWAWVLTWCASAQGRGGRWRLEVCDASADAFFMLAGVDDGRRKNEFDCDCSSTRASVECVDHYVPSRCLASSDTAKTSPSILAL